MDGWMVGRMEGKEFYPFAFPLSTFKGWASATCKGAITEKLV